ncbi:DUF3015 family protein [Treponema parvum]|uniref:DUF3015 family protein n=1 Tax=Treponema parvum TaxID=138851 RepID=A0A975F1S3_9SPIR|nr:DUF3015 family protein [Treponema parvum]QTQ13025.1 DUF3015 family protein [Treponema parvum]
MLKRKFAIALAVASLALTASTFATAVGPGLGYVFFGKKSGAVWDILAATTNGCCFSQFFAITFGTSGYEGGLIGMEETDKFIAENMDALAADIAKGDGEYVDTLSTMLNVADKMAFKAALQDNFDEIFSSSEVSAKEVSAKIYSFVG